MDWVRSCYSTMMVMDQQGGTYPADWYFVPAGTPLFGPQHPVSLNWARPEFGQATVGEVPGVARPYSRGQRPAYIPPSGTFAQQGTDAAFSVGGAGPASAPPAINFRGQRMAPGDAVPVFPPWQFQAVAPPLSSSIYGAATGSTVGPYTWQWAARNPPVFVYWPGAPGVPLWTCYPGLTTVYAIRQLAAGTVTRTLFCTSYSSTTHLSTWTDPDGGALDQGEVMTLSGF